MKVVYPLLALACVLSGCAESFTLPMTAAQLSAYDSPAALVTYLGQADASPTVCDMRATGPHVARLDEDTRAAVVDGLSDGKIAPEPWRRCASALLRSAPHEDSASLLDAIGVGYRRIMKRDDFETSAPLQARLQAMQQLYIDRKNELQGHAQVDDKLVADLRRALLQHRLGAVATRLGEDLVETVDLEHGQWLGRTVDVPMIDGLYAQKDEQTLLRFGKRLPSAPLRDEARRRVVRLHIAASPFPEVRDHAAAIEETVMKRGINPVSLAQNPALSGSIDPAKVPMRGVLVRQQLLAQTATLLGYSGDRPGISVLPELQLRGALLVQVKDISRPITLCGKPSALDPTPCLVAADVHLDNPAAYLDKGGAFHFVEHIYMRDALKLAQLRDKFLLPVSVGGKRLCAFEWRLYFERPDDLVFNGRSPGTNGPNLGVAVDARDPLRLFYTTSLGGAEQYVAVVEHDDASQFHVVSRGAAGASGSSGSDGMDGSSGSECGNGGDGSSGGNGSDGGDGGDGGNVVVNVACGAASCPAVVALAHTTIVSEGGAGGAGGAGGRGGRGGSGGSGRSPSTHTDADGNTVTDDSGCSAGSSGSDGSSGSNGSDGADGRAGSVRIQVVTPAS